MINLAVFGAGRIGYVHALNAASHAAGAAQVSGRFLAADRAAWRTRGHGGRR